LPTFEREPRPDKVEAVAELKDVLNAGTVILTDYQGLDVKSISNVRKKLGEAGTGYKVVKNNLLALASIGLPAEKLVKGLEGPTAIAYTSDDPVAAAKALQDFLKGPKPIKIKAGIVDGQILDSSQITELSKVPAKPVLLGMLVGGLQSPITGLVGTLQQLYGQLVFTLQGVADKRQAA